MQIKTSSTETTNASGMVNFLALVLFITACATFTAQAKPVEKPDFLTFETGPVNPIAINADGSRLFRVNTPDNRLEIFTVTADGSLKHQQSVAVGMEPVTVKLKSEREAWVVNHLSDSVSIIDISQTQAKVVYTLLVGDEPRDLVFAGKNNARAFITTAHRGQRRTDPTLADVLGSGDPQLFSNGIPRADVWVFNSTQLGNIDGGKPLKIIELFGDTPRALAVTADKKTVYAAVFLSGNQTTSVHDAIVCDTNVDGSTSGACYTEDSIKTPNGLWSGKVPGSLPQPTVNAAGEYAVESGLIVQYDNIQNIWKDGLGRNWNNAVRFNLPDKDVFAIDVEKLEVTAEYSHAGTILYNMAVNPVSGKLLVSNTEAQNQIRFEGAGGHGGYSKDSTVQGDLHRSQITVIDPRNKSVQPRHLNRHINYAVRPARLKTKQHSLALPQAIVVSANGHQVYLAAFGSSKVAVFNSAVLENDQYWNGLNTRNDPEFDPTRHSSQYIAVSGGGPSGLALDDTHQRLYVSTRFDNGISIIDLNSGREINHYTVFNPEPDAIIAGRPILYDAIQSSSNGETACASCHVHGDTDGLAWDLGNPDESNTKNTLCINFEKLIDFDVDPTIRDFLNGTGKLRDFSSMKGPMTTQTLKGMQNHGHMHWRGDRATGFFGTDTAGIRIKNGRTINAPNCFDKNNPVDYNEELSFKNFIVAFAGLMGSERKPDAADLQHDMQKFSDFMLATVLPPNPIRQLDNRLTAHQQTGRDFYHGKVVGDPRLRHADGEPANSGHFKGEPSGFTCEGCHRLNAAQGFFGTNGNAAFTGEIQITKVPQLRNLYQKVGMFGLPNRPGFGDVADPGHKGDQIRGFGYLHDGATDTLFNFMQGAVFVDDRTSVGFTDGHTGNQQRRAVEDYLMAFDSDLAPIVGQQVTIYADSGKDALQRFKLLYQRAQTPFTSKILGGSVTECDLIAKGSIDGRQRGYLLDIASNTFITDALADSAQQPATLLAAAQQTNNTLTFTCAPPGSGKRMALDRDLDGILDADDTSSKDNSLGSKTDSWYW